MGANYHNKNILQVLPSMISGGVERGTIDIAKAISANSMNSYICSNGGKMLENMPHNVKHIEVNLDTKNPFKIYQNIENLINVIKLYNIDLIHARSRAPAWSSYLAAKKLNKPFITTFHGTYNIQNCFKKYYNSVMTKGDRVIAVSNFIKQHILENYSVCESKIKVIHRGADIVYFDPNNIKEAEIVNYRQSLGVAKDQLLIILPGRITKWKGQAYFIEALKNLKSKKYKALIIGDISRHPKFLAELKTMVAHNNLAEHVIFSEPSYNMPLLYAASDIIVSASIEPEAFGRIAIEGQAMQKLTIATNIGGAKETIIDNLTGLHVDYQNPADLSEKLEYVIENFNNSKITKIINNSRQHIIDNFSLNNMQQQTISLYKEFI